MQKIEIKNAFPLAVDGIHDLHHMPLLQTDKQVRGRILKFFKKAFGNLRGDYSFIREKKELLMKYYEDLINMVHGENAKYPVVVIDGYANDTLGKDDIAIYLDMGIPRLRGTNVNYLDRIYLKLRTSQHGCPRMVFFCCPQYPFQLDKAYDAWHPHIQNGKPCLGGYEIELSDCYRNGSPIDYLESVDRFLNTWNRQSPFWNINRTTIDYNVDQHSFKGSIINWAVYRYLNSSERIKFPTSKILKYLEHVKCDNTAYALKFICQTVSKCVYAIDNLSTDIVEIIGISTWNRMRKIHGYHLTSGDTGQYVFSAFPRRTRDTYARLRTLYTTVDSTVKTQILVPNNDKTTYEELICSQSTHTMHDIFNKRETVYMLEKVIYETMERLNAAKILFTILNVDELIYKGLSLFGKYKQPLIYERMKWYDELDQDTKRSRKARHQERWSGEEGEKYDTMLVKISKRTTYLEDRLMKTFRDSLDDGTAEQNILKIIKSAFRYNTDHGWHVGSFWSRSRRNGEAGIESLNRRREILDDIGGVPKSLEDLLDKYDKLKQEYLLIENDMLKQYFSKIVRRLDRNHDKMQISDTKESPEQVQLSFD